MATKSRSPDATAGATRTLWTDESAVGILGIVLIVILVLILFGFIGFSIR